MFEEIVGTSRSSEGRSFPDLAKVAPTDSTVLITGETGTGKATHRPCRSQTIAKICSSLRECELCCASAHAGFLGIVWP